MKRNKNILQKNPQNSDSIYFHVEFGGRKRQRNSGIKALMGRSSLFCFEFYFAALESLFVLPIWESPKESASSSDHENLPTG